MKSVKLSIALAFILVFGLCFYRSLTDPSAVLASSSGPPPNRTGAPPEGTCVLCHFSYVRDDPSGGVRIDDLPKTYTPGGEAIPFTVTVFQDGTDGVRQDWGFELTVVTNDPKQPDQPHVFAGTLVVTDDVHTQIISSNVEDRTRYYIEQTLAGAYVNPEGAPSATWCMAWIPPDTDVGPVTFYVAANAGNGDGTPLGDYIFTTNRSMVPASADPEDPAGASSENNSDH